MLDLSQYDTTAASNDGVKFYPTLPGQDEPTDQLYFVVIGADSDEFRKIKISEARKALAINQIAAEFQVCSQSTCYFNGRKRHIWISTCFSA